MLTNTALRRILLGAMFLVLWMPEAAKLLQPLAQSVFTEMAGGDVAPAQRPCLSDRCDFIVFWSAGNLAAHGEADTVYDQEKFLAWERAHVFAQTPPKLIYVYPPLNLLATYLSGFLGFEWGFLLWSVVLVGAGLAILRLSGISWFVIAAGLFSVPALFSLQLGQWGFFTGAVFLAGLFWTDARPKTSGILFALLAIKPQSGLLGPVVLLARGEWRAFLTGAAVVVTACAAVTLIIGPSIWRDYFAGGMTSTRLVLVSDLNSNGISVFWMLRSFGVGLRDSYAGQLAAGVFAVAGCVYVWRQPAATREARIAATVFFSLLISPYVYTADMCGYAMAVAMLAEAAGRITLFDMFLWLAPTIFMNMGQAFHLLLTPVAMVLAIFRAADGLRPAASLLPYRNDK